MSVAATIVDQWSDGKRHHVIGTLAFSGNYTSGGDTLDFAAAGIQNDTPPVWFQALQAEGFAFKYVSGTLSTDGKLIIFSPGNNATATVQAAGTLTSDNTNVANGATVTIGSVVYTFVTALTEATVGATAVPYQVKIGTDADTSLTNLAAAINGTSGAGTTYGTGTVAHPYVTSGAVTSHAITVTAIGSGIAANSIATTETSAHLSWGAATLTGGVEGFNAGAQMSAGAISALLTGVTAPFYAIFQQLL